MNKIICCILLPIAVLFTSCSSGLNITFGSGGGFTGEYIEYVIDGDQTLSKSDPSSGELEVIRKVSKTEINIIVIALYDKEIESIDYNVPGNMSKYMEINNEGKLKRLTWSDEEQNESTEKLDFMYKLLINLVNKSN